MYQRYIGRTLIIEMKNYVAKENKIKLFLSYSGSGSLPSEIFVVVVLPGNH